MEVADIERSKTVADLKRVHEKVVGRHNVDKKIRWRFLQLVTQRVCKGNGGGGEN